MSSLALFAQAGAAYSIGSWAIMLIVIAAVIGIVLVGIRQAGITVPPFVATILWIVAGAVLCILAIKFVLSAV